MAARHGLQFSTELEARLREGLSALEAVANEMGALSVAVFLMRDGRTMRNLSIWPESNMAGGEVQLERAVRDTLRNFAGYAAENSPIAKFLQRTFKPRGTSFPLFRWGTDRLQALIVFGFGASSTAIDCERSDLPRAVGLAALATWSVYEVFRLHSELVIVNERLGTRKLIERAKGMLQTERGLDEE
jgi:hypothetical protein